MGVGVVVAVEAIAVDGTLDLDLEVLVQVEIAATLFFIILNFISFGFCKFFNQNNQFKNDDAEKYKKYKRTVNFLFFLCWYYLKGLFLWRPSTSQYFYLKLLYRQF